MLESNEIIYVIEIFETLTSLQKINLAHLSNSLYNHIQKKFKLN